MVRALRSLKIICLALALTAAAARAQEPENRTRGSGPRKQIAIIMFAGVAGGILGLSTLSFYGRPQDKLANVPIGMGVGIIIGTIYTTFKAATEPREFMNGGALPEPASPPKSFAPEAWIASADAKEINDPSLMGANWQWSF
jgi:hypothetical protein